MITKLKVSNTIKPEKVDDLNLSQLNQLVKAGQLYDGLDLSAQERLEASEDENYESETSFKGFLDIHTISDESNNHLYDAFLYMVDSGVVFKAGTLDVAAVVIQMGVECEDKALNEILTSLIYKK